MKDVKEKTYADYREQFLNTLKPVQKEWDLKQKHEQPKLSVTVSVKDTEVFQTMLNYTQSLIEILSKYPLSEDDEKKLNSISKGFFSISREVES